MEQRNIKVLQAVMLLIYKCILEFLFIPVYFGIYAYLYNDTFTFDFSRWVVSCLIFVAFIVIKSVGSEGKGTIYDVILCIYYSICIIPMLSLYVYANGYSDFSILYSTIFWVLMVLLIKYYGIKKVKASSSALVRIKTVQRADLMVLCVCVIVAFVVWARAGFPIIFSLEDTTTQRMEQRASNMPLLLNYIFIICGGVLAPYLFARYLDAKRYIYAVISLGTGMLLFFANGMKTWLFLYVFTIALFLLCNYAKEKVSMVCFLLIIGTAILAALSVAMYIKGNVSLISQIGRMILIPNNIGFKSIDFFSSHELLYLRESIFRGILETPYVGGSDFYINYGSRATLTSSRANNGLWGDAFRNFGLIGVLVYPFVISKIINLIEINGRRLNFQLQVFILLLVIWGSINVSFFTWLLTGGVIVVLFILKIDKGNLKQTGKITVQIKRFTFKAFK